MCDNLIIKLGLVFLGCFSLITSCVAVGNYNDKQVYVVAMQNGYCMDQATGNQVNYLWRKCK